jgi:hypothetical protein
MSMNAVPEMVIEAGHAECNYWRDLLGYDELFYCPAWRDTLVATTKRDRNFMRVSRQL